MEINQQQKLGIGEMISDAFHFWSKTIWYQILFSLLHFSVLFIVLYFFAIRFGILEQYMMLSEKLKLGMDAYREGVQQMTENPNFFKFQIVIVFTLSFLFPLNLGLMKMFRKVDLKEKVLVEDLFAGYSGANFFIYLGYYLFWFTVYSYALSTIFLGIVWVFITLFTAPLMFFNNKRIFETFRINLKALRLFPLPIFVAVIFAVIFKYGGLLSIVGAVFTFPFWNAIIYSLYSKIFVIEKNKKVSDNL